MLDLSTLEKYDSHEMYKIYDKWADIASEAYGNNYESVDFKNIDHIVFCGVGGSGSIGDTFSSILSKTDMHVCVVKGYHLPSTVDSNTLVVATSISGNTAETLSVLDSTRKFDCKIIAFSSGGKMENYCIKNNINYRKIDQIHSPRASLPTFMYGMLNILNSVIPIQKKDILESIKKLGYIQKRISSSNLVKGNPSLELAEWFTGIPAIYYPWGLQAAAIRFKNSLQENAKLHAMAEDVLESSHNGIVAWERKSNVQPVLIQGKDDHIKTKQRWKIIKNFFETNNIPYKEIHSVDGNILTKLISLIYLLDYSTIYLAALSKIDPTPVNAIEFIKRRLR